MQKLGGFYNSTKKIGNSTCIVGIYCSAVKDGYFHP